MWFEPEKYKKKLTNLNDVYRELQGELEDDEAKITLIKFLRQNLTFTVELLTGIRLAPYQEITLKGMLNRNNTLCVWGRGTGKSFMAAIYCIVQSIFEPNTKILIAGPTFRTARFIFGYIEEVASNPNAILLKQVLGVKSKRNDLFEWAINGGSIKAIPLNGEKIRGFRANVLLIDEFLLMPEDLVENVLKPFLVSPQDVGQRIKIRTKEDRLIADGKLTEKDRVQFENNSKMIALSSASFTFENLYKTYQEWSNRIYATKEQEDQLLMNIKSEDEREATRGATFFVSQMAWNAIPEYMMDKSIIESAGNNESRSASFLREYCAQFTDGSDSYFNAKKMHAQTIPDGEDPTVELMGDKEGKYILAIDPNASNSPTGDYFAMCVLRIDPLKPYKGVVVHNYAAAGKDLKEHIKYFYYLVTSFDIEMIVIDHAGFQFIDAANEHELFRKAKIEYKFFDFDPTKEGEEAVLELKNAKRNLNKTAQRIVFKQFFTTDFTRKSNEWLQQAIDFGRIYFGARIRPNETAFQKAITLPIDLELVGLGADEDRLISNLIEDQDFRISDLKKQCACIEVKTNVLGVQSFDMPASFKRDNTATRPRKDNYTALLLANWALKAYWDIRHTEDSTQETFTPFFAGSV